jgi:hypothetical protein
MTHVNTLQRPLPGPGKRPVQVTDPEVEVSKR